MQGSPRQTDIYKEGIANTTPDRPNAHTNGNLHKEERLVECVML